MKKKRERECSRDTELILIILFKFPLIALFNY